MFILNIFLFSFIILLTKCAPMTKHEGMDFLKKYGYMSNDTTTDEEFKTSLKDFQETYSLPATGNMDADTIKQMERPRCGRPDNRKIINKFNKWNHSKLTYKFKNFPHNGLSTATTRKEFQQAFKFWSDQVPLEFEEKPEGRKVDIDITFNRNGDGPGKTLAYAFFPRNGDMYFDNERWTSKSSDGFNLLTVATHELGHSLGLEHSNVEGALMFPYIAPYDPNFKLHEDDITRIQEVYGTKVTDICDLNSIDTAFFLVKESAVYIIKGNFVWKLKNGVVEIGYPKEISEKWKGSPKSIVAAYRYDGKMYFHDDKTIWKYDGLMKKFSNEKQLQTNIDDGVTYEDRTYVFIGNQYYKYENMKNVAGYPKPISSFWTGIPNSIDAVYYEDKYPYKYMYFFKGNKVYKFNVEDRKMVINFYENKRACMKGIMNVDEAIVVCLDRIIGSR